MILIIFAALLLVVLRLLVAVLVVVVLLVVVEAFFMPPLAHLLHLLPHLQLVLRRLLMRPPHLRLQLALRLFL